MTTASPRLTAQLRFVQQALMSLLWILSTLMIPSSSHAAIFFDDSFETCVVGGGASFPCEGWDDFGQEQPSVVNIVTSQAFSGSKSYQQHLDSATGTGLVYKPSIYKSFPLTDHVFARWAIKWSVPFTACQINGYTKHIRFVMSAGFPKVWIMNYYGTYAVVVEAPYYGGTTLFQTGVPVTSGKWDQIEFEWKLNTPGQADGLLRFWIDGVLRIEALNKEWRGPTPTSVHPIYGTLCPTPSNVSIKNTQIYAQCGIGNVWYDRFAVANTRIGLVNGTPPPPPPPVDTQAPSIPASLRAQAVSSSQINLTWNASTDTVGVTGYRIFRSSTQIGTATGTAYSNTSLSALTAYSYTVSAYDAAGNVSGQSAAASTTTHAVTTGAIGTVSNLSATATGANSATLSFTEVTDGAGQPAKYDVRFSSSSTLWGAAPSVTQGTCATPLAGTTVGATKTCTVLGLSPSTAYQFQLIAFRGTIGAGAVYGTLSNLAGASTSSAANVMPPAKPRNLRTR